MSRGNITKWLYVGLHIKRWLALLAIAVAIMGIGFAYILREVYVSYTFPVWAFYITLQFIPRWLRGLLFIAAALSLAIFSGWQLNRSLAHALLPSGDRQRDLVDLVYQNRTRDRGPRVVAIGGGTGLSNLLRGLKQYTSNLTAIVTVADDGGSSGRLRRDLHVIPPVEMWVEPRDSAAHPGAVRALLEADLIVIGPGSLYTSVLPNLLVPGIGKAVKESHAHKLYISNVATQLGETNGYTAADHYAALRRHLQDDALVDVVLANSNLPSDPLNPEWHSDPVLAPGDADYGKARLVLADIVDHERRYRHDGDLLAAVVMRAYFERDLRVAAPAAFEAR